MIFGSTMKSIEENMGEILQPLRNTRIVPSRKGEYHAREKSSPNNARFLQMIERTTQTKTTLQLKNKGGI